MVVFTLVFYQFFKIRWPMPEADGTALEYGLNVFAGLAVFNFFAEILNRAPQSILSHPNLVTKVRFPLPLLPAVTAGAAFIHIAVGILFVGVLSLDRANWLAWAVLPAFVLPMVFYGLAMAWLVSAFTVYLRDIAHAALPLSNVILFLSPIFYPTSAVPESLRWLVSFNPVAWAVDALRALLLHGDIPSGAIWLTHLGISALLMVAAFAVFRKLSSGFPDVI